MNHRFRAALRAHGGAVNTREQWARIVEETFLALSPERPDDVLFPALYDRFRQAEVWRIFDDAEPAFVALKQRGVKLGVISNWDDRLRPLLGVLKLAAHFDTMTISCEVGESKPSPGIFREAVKQLNVPANHILHVGDSFEMDVQGARAAGLNALQIEREPESARAGQIVSLLELPSVI